MLFLTTPTADIIFCLFLWRWILKTHNSLIYNPLRKHKKASSSFPSNIRRSFYYLTFNYVWACEINSLCWELCRTIFIFISFEWRHTLCAMRWCVTYKNEIFTGVKGLEEDMWENFISKEECEDLLTGCGRFIKIYGWQFILKIKFCCSKTFSIIF